jgi:hypothetical protein
MLLQVAQSKGTEWMVSAYNSWQQRSPLKIVPEKNPSLFIRLVSSLSQKERRLQDVMALSFRSVLIILGIILSAKTK